MAAHPHSITLTCPSLEPGDHLTPAEFRRRYELRHDIKKAELIDGVVYMPSPTRLPEHATPHALLTGEVALYSRTTAGLIVGDNATVRFDDGNEVQPDLLLRYARSRGGTSTVGEDGYVAGPPELVAEIAASSATYDLHEKKALYARQGVQEYLVWRTEDDEIDWWELSEGTYIPLLAEHGVVRSRVFPGLEINVTALLETARAARAADEGA